MMSGQHNVEHEDDAAPVDMLVSLFEARGWPCEHVGDDEVSGEVQGSWANSQVRGIWRREDHCGIHFTGPPKSAPPRKW